MGMRSGVKSIAGQGRSGGRSWVGVAILVALIVAALALALGRM